MIYEFESKRPKIDPSAYISDSAIVIGDVTIGARCYVGPGAVIRGDTTHHEYVAGEAAKGLAHVGLEHRVPVAFGILTCDNLEQALMRSGSKAGNKGAEAALAALETAKLMNEIRGLGEAQD